MSDFLEACNLRRLVPTLIVHNAGMATKKNRSEVTANARQLLSEMASRAALLREKDLAAIEALKDSDAPPEDKWRKS